MSDPKQTQPLLKEALQAIDNGNEAALRKLLTTHPQLVDERMDEPREGYFKEPYLLWFIADNPIRNGKLPSNITDIASLLVEYVQRNTKESRQLQLDYALGLVATGSVPRESGVQTALMDLLIDAGASPGPGIGALAHGNPGAAAHLLKRGAKLTLPVAICLDKYEEIPRLLQQADDKEKELALVAAAFYGKADKITLLIKQEINLNAFPDGSSGFHSHATALHQAIYSGSLESVKLLVEAGARLDLEDRVYQGTPIGWAEYMIAEESDELTRPKFKRILDFLNSLRPENK